MPSSVNPTHAALATLLPSSFTIPPRLLSTADLLLSLSRQRQPHLKPDEEIARAHTCAEIAWKRLRAPLRLPNIKSGNGAPCRPAVYKKLLSFLEKVLEDVDVLGTPKRAEKRSTTGTPGTGKSTGTGRGRKRNIEALTAEDEESSQVETPSKKAKRGDLFTTPTKSSTKKINGFVGKIIASASKSHNRTEAPDYVLPAIRKLCKAFKTPKLVPHVYTGVCVILDLADDENNILAEGGDTTRKNLSLTIAVYLMTLTRMQKGLMTTEVYNAVSERSVSLLELQEDDEEVQTEVENWITRINDEEWTTLPGSGEDWWSSIPEDIIPALKLSAIDASSGADSNVEAEAMEDEEATPRARNVRRPKVTSRRDELRKQLEEEDPDDILLPGLGTMVNDAVDYLSEERNADYQEWKADVLRRIDAMEKGDGGGGTKKGKGRAVAAAA